MFYRFHRAQVCSGPRQRPACQRRPEQLGGQALRRLPYHDRQRGRGAASVAVSRTMTANAANRRDGARMAAGVWTTESGSRPSRPGSRSRRPRQAASAAPPRVPAQPNRPLRSRRRRSRRRRLRGARRGPAIDHGTAPPDQTPLLRVGGTGERVTRHRTSDGAAHGLPRPGPGVPWTGGPVPHTPVREWRWRPSCRSPGPRNRRGPASAPAPLRSSAIGEGHSQMSHLPPSFLRVSVLVHGGARADERRLHRREGHVDRRIVDGLAGGAHHLLDRSSFELRIVEGDLHRARDVDAVASGVARHVRLLHIEVPVGDLHRAEDRPPNAARQGARRARAAERAAQDLLLLVAAQAYWASVSSLPDDMASRAPLTVPAGSLPGSAAAVRHRRLPRRRAPSRPAGPPEPTSSACASSPGSGEPPHSRPIHAGWTRV